ncbi:MAG: flavodoxin family protein [Candidatus Fervidibacter sp.]|uniref:flavodoxin family protein n=1 Tax=Candidatus Fervidibacter sp. TaxID=3100871 RepID=UPI00404B741A
MKGVKVLGIMGSSRRDGNTNDLLDVALKGAQEVGAEVEKLVLADYRINHIADCKICRQKGECVNEDDLPQIIEKLLETDVHIWASPVYWYTVSGLVKVLIDRFFCYIAWHPEVQFAERMKGKGAALIAVQEERDPERAAHLLGCMQWSFEFLGQVFLGFVLGPGGSRGATLKDEKVVKQAFELGKKVAEFARSLRRGDRK